MKSYSQKRLIKACNSGMSRMRQGSVRNFSCAQPLTLYLNKINLPEGRRSPTAPFERGYFSNLRPPSLCLYSRDLKYRCKTLFKTRSPPW